MRQQPYCPPGNRASSCYANSSYSPSAPELPPPCRRFTERIRTPCWALSGNNSGADKAASQDKEQADAGAASAMLTGRKVQLDADGRGHFIGDFQLNGRTVTALIDTGATVVALNRSTARRIGISPPGPLHRP